MIKYGKLIFTHDGGGVIREHKFDTEAEAKAYVLGFNDAKEQVEQAEEMLLDDFHAVTDSEPAKDED